MAALNICKNLSTPAVRPSPSSVNTQNCSVQLVPTYLDILGCFLSYTNCMTVESHAVYDQPVYELKPRQVGEAS